MIDITKFILFTFTYVSFGFLFLNSIAGINSLILLIPFSIVCGLSSYLFICHLLSFLIGPQLSSFVSLLFLLFISILILITNYPDLKKFRNEISKGQLLLINSISLIICFLTFLAIYTYGPFDANIHTKWALSIFHNNIYPPRDCFRPDYILLYHYGADLLGGAIQNLCNLNILTCFELVAIIQSGTTFLSFFALAWLITNNFKLSLISAFCTYFGGGLLWLDSIVRYFTHNLPSYASNWSFLQTYLNLGTYGSIYNAPSMQVFATYNSSNSMLILCLVLLKLILKTENIKSRFTFSISLIITLFSLSMTADWLYVTFFIGLIPVTLFLFFKKNKELFVSLLCVMLVSIFLTQTVGNPIIQQDPIQLLGRASGLEVALKENLFHLTTWGRLTNEIINIQPTTIFSWDLLYEFGLSLILFPFTLIYLIKNKKDVFILFLFLTSLLTIPIPFLFEYKLHPVEFIRLLTFPNTILILLNTCAIGSLCKPFLIRKSLIFIYLLFYCLTPISQFLSAIIFTAHTFYNKGFVYTITNDLKNVRSGRKYLKYLIDLHKSSHYMKSLIFKKYKDEINFLKINSKPNEVAISSLIDLPAYVGIYTLVPSNKVLYKDCFFSSYDNIFPTVLKTLDPFLLNELNIKWIILNKKFKNDMPKEIQEKLDTSDLFKLVFSGLQNDVDTKKDPINIYHITNLKKRLFKFTRKIAWILVNKDGLPIEVTLLKINRITLFPSSRDVLVYLKELHKIKPEIKKELITAQPFEISTLEKEIQDRKLDINLDKRW